MEDKDALKLEKLEQMIAKLQQEIEYLKKSNQEKREKLENLEEQIAENED